MISERERAKKPKTAALNILRHTVALHQFGFNNSVALMGVAISDFSIQKLSSLTKNIYFLLDNDDAGMKAMKRINKQFLEHDLIAKYVSFDELLTYECSKNY